MSQTLGRTATHQPAGSPPARAPPVPEEARHGPLWAQEEREPPASRAVLERAQALAGNQAIAGRRAEALDAAPAPVPEEGEAPAIAVDSEATAPEAPQPVTAPGATTAPAPGPEVPEPAHGPLWAARPMPAAGGAVPRDAAALRAAAAAGAAALPMPAFSAEAAVAPIQSAGRTIEARGQARIGAARVAPRHLVRGARQPAPPPREDPGPIPAQMEALQAKARRELPPAALPEVQASPEGTMPNLGGPVLTEEELRLVRLGDVAIDARGLSAEEATRLKTIRQQLSQGAVASMPPPATSSVASPALTSAPVLDEPVTGEALTPEQRALFAQVVGQVAGEAEAEAAEVLATVRQTHAAFPGGALEQAWLASEGVLRDDDLKPTVLAAVRGEARLLAESLGMAQMEVEGAIVARRDALKEQRDGVCMATAAAVSDARSAASAAALGLRAQAGASADAAREAAMRDRRGSRRGRPTARERVERSVTAIRDKVVEAEARFDAQLRNRQRAINEAVRRQGNAYRMAQTRDELALEPLGLAAMGRRAMVRRWADGAATALNRTRDSLNTAAGTAVAGFKTELEAAGRDAFAALRDWGSRQSGATETWWTELDQQLNTWATDATAQTTAWQGAQAQASRVALAQDLAAVQRIVALQEAGQRDAAREYRASLGRESQAVVNGILGAGGVVDLVAGLTAGLRERVRAAQQPVLEPLLEDKVMALPDKAESMAVITMLLQASQPEFDLNKAATDIHDSVTRWRGTDEAKIFAALQNLSPLAVKALRIQYRASYGDSLDDDLRGDLNDEEMATANRLLEGNRNRAAVIAGAVGSLYSAITGLGTDTEEAKELLRRMDPQLRTEVLAEYERIHGESFATAIRGEWISNTDQESVAALTEGDLRRSDAIELGGAMSSYTTGGDPEMGGGETQYSFDRGTAMTTYARIRREVEEEARRHGEWTTADIEAEIALRNNEVEGAFNTQFANAPWAKDAQGTALHAAFQQAGGASTDLLGAIARNDLAAADVARLRLEDQGVYASDAAINGVFRDQASRSRAELQRDLGPVLAARTADRLEEEDRTTHRTAEERFNRRLELEREGEREMARLADERTRARMQALGVNYQAASGRSLSAMIEDNMSGVARKEALARVAQDGVLTPYQRLRFAIEGVGTDMPELRGTLSGMTSEELEEADRQWKDEHGGESLISAIEGDTSGREQDDLVDMATHGRPMTAQEMVDQARRRYDRDRGDETFIGSGLTGSESAAAKRELEMLEGSLARMRDPRLSAAQQRAVGAAFEIRVDRTLAAIEVQRAAVDSLADTLSTIAAVVAAVVVGALLSPFTGGGSAVVAAAVIASLTATAASMLTKALVKGGAYGTEEIGTDLAIGAVDAVVSAVTAGLGHALLGRLAKGITPVGRSSLFQGLSRMGRLGAMAARGQARIASTLGRFGTAGPLARALEGRAMLAGLAAETRPLYQRLAAQGAAQLIEQGVQALPSSFAGAMLDERVWRQPGGPMQVLQGTLQGTLQSVASGMGFAAAHHVASHGFGMVTGAFRNQPVAEPHLRSDDVLAHMGRPEDRLADFRRWREANPQGSMRDFYAARLADAIAASGADAAQRQRVREARRALLSGEVEGQPLSGRERGGFADVPILPLGEAEFRRLGGTGDAALVVRDGQAVILLRDGAPPSAVRPLLSELRGRVYADAGGMTLEAALPRRLRDAVPVRRGAGLHGDEVRVVLIPPEGGPLQRVELHVGPEARPVDVALHAGELDRVRGWMGRMGEARQALAGFGQRLGLDIVTPHDRARFEAAGEVRKLTPIIEERMRRYMLAGDARGHAAIELEIRHLMAQQEAARRILTGEVVATPQGYVAARSTKPKPGAAAPPPLSAEMQAHLQANAAALALENRLAAFARSREITMRDRSNALTGIDLELRRLPPHLQRWKGELLAHFGGPDPLSEPLFMREPLARSDPALRQQAERVLRSLDGFRETLADRHARMQLMERAEAKIRAELALLPPRAQLLGRLNAELNYAALSRGPEGVCFPPGTGVATPGGRVPIAALRAGATVLAMSAAGQKVVARVAARLDGWTDWLVAIHLPGETVLATRSHRFAVGGGWQPARLLRPGMVLETGDGRGASVRAVRRLRCATPTCNLEVVAHHTFLVGAAGVVVHNGDVEAARSYHSTTAYLGQIYYISVRRNGVWVLAYVGSTNKEGLTRARFLEHVGQGRPGNLDFTERKRAWAEAYDRARGREVVRMENGLPTHEFGDVRVQVVVEGQFTDLALAIVEQAHINANNRQGQLVNNAAAIGQNGFEKYYGSLTREQRVPHSPCR
ncbi:hypothetical protein [Roseomonas marmotae]|uniref:Hint domain-containing protein n=1 Tax=Roseomonas marmotae TaxID=2768161 RepID=A0ABS3KFG0_9PROT|nr:hypothetical protein [Roseomonas marmotae]MBO1076167.1 hypothetical protein [Roseomonas marmotae]QTI81796.1 hypothetical protein IAI58_20790 [Roseomonas marmotae]